LKIAFSNELNWESIKQQYRKDQRVCITNVWSKEVAESISNCLQKETNFSHAYTLAGQPTESSDQEIKAMKPQQQHDLFRSIYSDAAQGAGFFYGRHAIEHNSPKLLQAVKEYFNSSALLKKISDLSGKGNLNLASAQGTRYVKGSFLTRHRDVVANEGRVLAYVLSFTPVWHPDCGGLLQFYQDDGTPRDAWTPQFNSLTIFDVRHVHSVTYVPPFAPSQRVSITGWFRSQ